MTRILIAGLKEPPGGVENAVLTYTRGFDKENIRADFAVCSGELSFSDRIDTGDIIYLPGRVRHPLAYRKKLDEIFRNGGYDALWCNYSGLTNIDFLKTAKKYNVRKRIIHSHTSALSWGNKLMEYVVPYLHGKNQKVIDRYATDFWACSEKSAVFMYGSALAKKAVIIPNCIDTEKFIPDESIKREVKKEFGISDSTTVLCHVGRMCREKNQKLLLDILKEVLKIKPDTVLLFIGDGELREEILAYSEENGTKDNVIFTLARNDVPRLLQAADVFLLPSLNEGFPVTLVEAQACNIPCVVSSEAVVKEADMTDSISFVSLEDAPEKWARTVIMQSERKITDGIKKLCEKGFDSRICSQNIEKFFTGEK